MKQEVFAPCLEQATQRGYSEDLLAVISAGSICTIFLFRVAGHLKWPSKISEQRAASMLIEHEINLDHSSFKSTVSDSVTA